MPDIGNPGPKGDEGEEGKSGSKGEEGQKGDGPTLEGNLASPGFELLQEFPEKKLEL